jgi:hypothetical protein
MIYSNDDRHADTFEDVSEIIVKLFYVANVKKRRSALQITKLISSKTLSNKGYTCDGHQGKFSENVL